MADKKVLVEGKAVSVENTKTVIGFNQIGKTTPDWAKKTFRIALYVATALTLVTQIVTEIPREYADAIAKYALEAVALIHALTKLAGVNIDDAKG